MKVNTGKAIWDLPGIVVGGWRLTSGQINKQRTKYHVENVESMIKVGDGGTSGIDIEYVLDSSTDVKSEV